MAILIIIPKLRGSESLNTKTLLKFIVFFQYIPRFLRLIPLYKEVTRTSGILTETAWAGAAFNLFLYMLASHVRLCSVFFFFFSLFLVYITDNIFFFILLCTKFIIYFILCILFLRSLVFFLKPESVLSVSV